MKNTVQQSLRAALESLSIAPPAQIEVGIPKDDSHGDFASPIAMSLAKQLRRSPRDLALALKEKLDESKLYASVEVAGPGFLNFTLSGSYIHGQLARLIHEGCAFLRTDVGLGRRVQIEFVSANPTGPLHVGHGRGAAVGDALANLMQAAGYSITREYYVNDAGRQVRMLAASIFARYQELLGREGQFPEDGYRGDYVIDIAKDYMAQHGTRHAASKYEDVEQEFCDYGLVKMLAAIKDDLAAFGVKFDVWQSERELYSQGGVAHAIEFLRGRDYVYDHEGAVWFRATSFGDDKDRVVIKSDGAPTYFASDIAYHLKKIESGYGELINIWGADHHGYIPRLEAVIEALGYDRKHLSVLLAQMVSLVRAGVPVQMSKRSGDFVTLRDLVDEVGSDITRFIFLTRRHDSQLTFDLETAKAQSAENPVFYVQYAYARIGSIFNKAVNAGINTDDLHQAQFTKLQEPEETRLIRKILSYGVLLEQAALAREPHRVTYYLQELAGTFHPYYNKHRVLVDDDAELARARLALCLAVKIVLEDGLKLLGIAAPERM